MLKNLKLFFKHKRAIFYTKNKHKPTLMLIAVAVMLGKHK